MTIKYQYIRPLDFDTWQNPKFKDLCICISTELELQDHKHSICHWVVAFKHPKDQFNKSQAREAINNNEGRHGFSGQIILSNNYTRNEIVCKILMQLCINECEFTKPYVDFIRYLIRDYLDYKVL